MDGPAASRTLLTDVADYFDHAPRGAAIETIQKFGIPSGTPFTSFLRSFRAVVASTVDKGGPLAPSSEHTTFSGRGAHRSQKCTKIPTPPELT